MGVEVFQENLNDLVVESGKSLRQLERESGVTAVQFSRYLRGAIPTITVTIKIADYFGCSLDFLFGLTDCKMQQAHTQVVFDVSKFIANYEALLKANNTTNYKLMPAGGFDESVIRHWKRGATPRLDIVYYIAKSLNGSIDELIGLA